MDARKTGSRHQSQRQARLIVLRFSIRKFALPWLAAGLSLLVAQGAAAAQAVTSETVTIDARTAAKPFPHFWEQCATPP
jgi:hypothetical protein